MPKGDRTDPMKTGAISGRTAGLCAGFDMPGNANPASAKGLGMGMGRKRGGWGGPTADGKGWLRRSLATGRTGR